jgi:hypothetical protein
MIILPAAIPREPSAIPVSGEINDDFDLGRLGKHVERRDGNDGQLRREFGQIERERRGIAGGVDRLPRRGIEDGVGRANHGCLAAGDGAGDEAGRVRTAGRSERR